MTKRKLGNDVIKLIIIFLIGSIITLPMLIPSFNVDGYCLVSGGYLQAARTFMKSGRIFTALVYVLNNYLKIPYKLFSIISIILSNLFLALAINKLASYLEKNNKLENNLNKFLLYLSCGLIFYNPLISELFLFEESFIFFLGIYLVVISVIKMNDNKLLSSFIILILATTCYQGIICFYIPLVFLLLVLNNNKIIDIVKKMFLAFLLYGMSLVISYIFVKIINTFIFTEATKKIGNLNIFVNIKLAYQFFIRSIKNLYGYLNAKIYYAVSLILLIVILLSKKENITFGYLIMNLLLLITIPFIPNLGMNSVANYTEARMALSMGSIIGIISIYGIIKYHVLNNTNFDRIFVGIIMFYSIYNGLFVFENSYIALKTYKNDMNSLNKIYEVIDNYEKEKDIKIKTIYYAMDKYVDWNYQYLYANSSNYRLFAVEWSLGCAINMNERNYVFLKMDTETKNKYFGDVDYKTFNMNQFVFVNDTLYLLLY